MSVRIKPERRRTTDSTAGGAVRATDVEWKAQRRAAGRCGQQLHKILPFFMFRSRYTWWETLAAVSHMPRQRQRQQQQQQQQQQQHSKQEQEQCSHPRRGTKQACLTDERNSSPDAEHVPHLVEDDTLERPVCLHVRDVVGIKLLVSHARCREKTHPPVSAVDAN